jgi:hypothetical protein
MQLDRKTLQKLLSLNDEQLTTVIRTLAESSGLDLSEFNIRPDDINSIRTALSGATEEDLLRATEQLRDFRRNKR